MCRQPFNYIFYHTPVPILRGKIHFITLDDCNGKPYHLSSHHGPMSPERFSLPLSQECVPTLSEAWRSAQIADQKFWYSVVMWPGTKWLSQPTRAYPHSWKFLAWVGIGPGVKHLFPLIQVWGGGAVHWGGHIISLRQSLYRSHASLLWLAKTVTSHMAWQGRCVRFPTRGQEVASCGLGPHHLWHFRGPSIHPGLENAVAFLPGPVLISTAPNSRFIELLTRSAGGIIRPCWGKVELWCCLSCFCPHPARGKGHEKMPKCSLPPPWEEKEVRGREGAQIPRGRGGPLTLKLPAFDW